MENYKDILKNLSDVNKEKFIIKNIEFQTDSFEELILQDIMNYDEETKIKLSRDITEVYNTWVKKKLKKKENVSINIKGDTRSGKSLVALKHSNTLCKFYGKDFVKDIDKIVCANQIEYRSKVALAEFGDCFQIDENDFANTGIGSNIEMLQLRDMQNIIAKKNIHTTYLTPKVFLNNVSTIGFTSHGRDDKNWLSKFLCYSLKSMNPTLMGYVIFNVGELFLDYGCFLFKDLGGCTNPNKLTFEQLDKELIENSFCIPKDYDKSLINNEGKDCPFYNLCLHPLCKYEHKKDTWINRQMKGGFDERTKERYTLVIRLLPLICAFDIEYNGIRSKTKNFKEIKISIKLLIPTLTNMKLGVAEFDEVAELVRFFLHKSEFLFETLEKLNNPKLEEELWLMENGQILKQKFIKFKEEKKLIENETK